MSSKRLTRTTRRALVGGTVLAGAVTAAVVTAVAASAGTGGGHTAAVPADVETGEPAAYAPVVPRSPGASAQPRIHLAGHLSPAALGERVAAAMGPASGVEAVTLRPDGRKSAIVVRMARYDDDVAQGWYAELAAGAAAQLSATGQASYNQAVSSATVRGPNAEGVTTSTDLGVGAAALDQAFDSPGDEALTTRVGKVARRFGLGVESVQVLHPLESALSVTLTVPDDARVDWTIDDLRTAFVGGTPDVEGVLIRLNAEDGTSLLQAGAAYRTGAGSLSFAPGQDDRFGAVHGGLAVAR